MRRAKERDGAVGGIRLRKGFWLWWGSGAEDMWEDGRKKASSKKSTEMSF